MKDFVTPLQTNQLRCWRNAWLHYNEACANPVQSALLIQHVHPSRTLYNWAREFILRNPATREAQEEWAGWMVQLHFALWALEGVFQHRDLHENNILVYSPLNPNEYLTFRYHLGGLQGKTSRVMEMKSRSWVVMVDYGRVWGKGRVPTPSPDGRGWTETPADSASWLFRQLSSVQNCSEYARRTPEMFQSYSAYPRDVDLMVANGFQSIVQEWTPNWFHGQSWTSAKDVCLEYYDFLTTNFHLHAGRSQFQKETWTECGTVDVYGDGRPMKWNLYEPTTDHVEKKETESATIRSTRREKDSPRGFVRRSSPLESIRRGETRPCAATPVSLSRHLCHLGTVSPPLEPVVSEL
jgi:hypothetical protein